MFGSTTAETERINAPGIWELEEAAANGLSLLGEADVVDVRRVERFEIDGVLHGRLDENFKEDPDELEAV